MRNRRGVGNEKRLLAGWMCVVLLVVSIMPTGLQVRAAEVGIKTESEHGAVGEVKDKDVVDDADGDNASEGGGKNGESRNKNDNNNGSEDEGNNQENGDKKNGEEDKVGNETGDENEGVENTGEGDGAKGDVDSDEDNIENDGEDSEGIGNIEDGEIPDQVVERIDDKKEADLDELLSVSAEERLKLMSSEEDIASGTYGDIAWVIDGNGKLTVKGTGEIHELVAGDNSFESIPWNNYCIRIKSAKITVTGMTDASYLFESCTNLTNLDLSEFNTDSVTSMQYMFGHCSSLTGLDLSKFNTGNVINMRGMFIGCFNLDSIDINQFNTSKVTNMSYMFYQCANLSYLDLSGFNTSKVTNMSYMFYQCENLTSIDLSGFNTSKVTDMSHMFHMPYLGRLASLDVSGFKTENVMDMSYMFYGCRQLVNLDVSGFDTGKVANMRDMFCSCTMLTNLDVSGFDTSKVTNMTDMFWSCSSLTNLDVSKFDTKNVTGMSHMFSACSSLISVDVSGFDTRNVTSMGEMFQYCSSLTSLDVSGFDTDNVGSMRYMFCNCPLLTDLDVSGFNTNNVVDMQGMFLGCSRLSSVDVSRFDTRNVTDMFGIFSDCSGLTSVDVSGFDTKNVTTMGSIFSGCSGLTSVDVSGFDTRNVTDMRYMFSNCSNLTSLDLSGFNMINIPWKDGVEGMLLGVGANIIYTPYNLKYSVLLPIQSGDTWYRSDGTIVTELPQNLSYSVALGKNYIPEERVEEIEGITIGSAELISNINVPKDKSVLYIMDGKTEEPIEQARIWINGEHYTGADGIVQLDQEGLTTIQIEKEGYHKKTVKKRLKKGKSTIILLSPNTGDLQIVSASLNLSGEDEDVLETITYLTHKELTQVTNGTAATFTLTAEASGNPQRYQLIQNGKVLKENTTGIFELKGKYSNGKDGAVTYYTDELAAGYMVSVRVFGTGGSGESNQTHRQELGIRISEATSGSLKIKEIGSDGKVELGDKLTVTLPDQIPILGGSSLDFGFENELPVKITVDNSGLVKIALNMGDYDSGDSNAWSNKKREFNTLAQKAINASDAGAAFGGKPQPFGAGMFSVEGSIVGYGEGYWDERSDSLCITVNVIANVKAEKKYTKYCFLPLIVPIPVYITFGGGVSLKVAQGIDFALSGDGLLVNGGTCEIETSIYVTP